MDLCKQIMYDNIIEGPLMLISWRALREFYFLCLRPKKSYFQALAIYAHFCEEILLVLCGFSCLWLVFSCQIIIKMFVKQLNFKLKVQKHKFFPLVLSWSQCYWNSCGFGSSIRPANYFFNPYFLDFPGNQFLHWLMENPISLCF